MCRTPRSRARSEIGVRRFQDPEGSVVTFEG